jgi:hypothetical protein
LTNGATSLYERFSSHYSLNDVRDVVLSNLENTSVFLKKLTDRGLDDSYIQYTFDDLILRHPETVRRIEKLIEAPLNRASYMSRLSLGKWRSSPAAYPLLHDPEFRRVGERFGYRYPRLARPMWVWVRKMNEYKRMYQELRLAVDTAAGKVDAYNLINAKHSFVSKGLVGRVCGKLTYTIANRHKLRLRYLLKRHNARQV